MSSRGEFPRRRGRPPKGARGDTRQELLDAALRLFAEQGYAGTTVRQIATEVGVRDSAIYAHFNAKREIFDALVNESGAALVDRLPVDFTTMGERDPAEALVALAEALLAEWDALRNRQLISVLAREGLDGPTEGLTSLQRKLAGPFGVWVSRGALRDDVDRAVLLWEFTVPLAAVRLLYLNAAANTAERREGKRHARHHLEFFLNAAAPSPATPLK